MNQFSSRKPVVALSRRSSKTLIAQAIAASWLVASSGVMAQSSEGTISGTAKAGSTVVITSLENGTSRQVQADDQGNFTLPKLSPGKYKVGAGEVVVEVSVVIGSGTRVQLVAPTSLETVAVVSSKIRPAIDVSQVESNTVFTADEINQLPVGRSPTSVALLAPGVVKSDSAYSVPSFGGASAAENGYYINGFDVTNIRNFLSYADLPFEAISQQQIKTGGYGAEYGRSLGGVISLSTKQGTNEWHGGASVYWSPAGLRASSPDVLNKDTGAKYYLFQSANTSSSFTSNYFLGGPIIQDKLFVFALAEVPNSEAHVYGSSTSYSYTSKEPTSLVKIDFLPTESTKFELTSIINKQALRYSDYKSLTTYSTNHDIAYGDSVTTSGGSVTIGKFTGYLTDNLTVSAMLGRVEYQNSSTTGYRVSSLSCPYAFSEAGTKLGCWASPGRGDGYVRDPASPPFDMDNRDAFRFDLEYVLGNHTFKAGIDNQKFTSTSAAGLYYSGGRYLGYIPAETTAVDYSGVSVPANTPLVEEYIYGNTGGAYKVVNEAFYVEDSWKVSKDLTLYGGLRWESFNNMNADDKSFVKKDNLLAPRIGASWDVNGDSSLKVFGTLGRYFIPVASNTNIRATRGETVTDAYYTYSSIDPVTGAPVNPQLVVKDVISDGRLANPGTIADLNLSPMSQDELIIGFQKAISKGWTGGVKFTSRKINDGMDDFCDHATLSNYVKTHGYPNFKDASLASCMLINPGRDVSLLMDLNDNGKLVPFTVPNSAIGMAQYTRTYNALELSLTKEFDGDWGGTASYTLSRSYGTAEGYVNSTINQVDAGTSQDFDFARFSNGSEGRLPNDRTHAIKIYGTKAIDANWRIGANLNITSGRPKSIIGYVPGDGAPDKGYSVASTYYYIDPVTKQTVLGQRGNDGQTSVTSQLDLQLAYSIKLGKDTLSFQADVFNVTNNDAPTEVTEKWDYSRATTTVGSATNRINKNFGLPQAFQTPRSFRFGARYEF